MRLLIVGALDGLIVEAGKLALARGARVAHVETIEGALTDLRAGKGADLVMMDVGMDIARLVKGLTSERINCPVVACGIGETPKAAAAAIRAGAKEFIPLPPDAELIAAILEAATEESNQVIFADPLTERVLSLAAQVAPSDASVLVTGESGTGKEVVSRFLHRKSKRAAKPFIAVNCAAIPENLLESELFGHEKGAFTGAVARRIGKFEEANGGTLLLDEISEMHPRLQAKLLRALQEREIDRVGGAQPIKVDVRLIATSNRKLAEEVDKGSFREDLYYRLNVMNIEMPSLRDRRQDIRPLSEYFARRYGEANGLPERPLTEPALAKLEAHHWRGNVRELENTMHRAVLLAEGDEIGVDAIVMTGATPVASDARSGADADSEAVAETLVGRSVADVERDLIINTLQHCLGNRTHAANILGISIRTLRNKLKQYTEEGIAVPMPGEGDRAPVG